jgi:hypothetical protein
VIHPRRDGARCGGSPGCSRRECGPRRRRVDGRNIAHLIAADHPEHTLSLTSAMSDTLNPALPPPSPEIMRAFPAVDRHGDPQGYADDMVRHVARASLRPRLTDRRRQRNRLGRVGDRHDDSLPPRNLPPDPYSPPPIGITLVLVLLVLAACLLASPTLRRLLTNQKNLILQSTRHARPGGGRGNGDDDQPGTGSSLSRDANVRDGDALSPRAGSDVSRAARLDASRCVPVAVARRFLGARADGGTRRDPLNISGRDPHPHPRAHVIVPKGFFPVQDTGVVLGI